ncbi:MAG TPA: response regulator transcription factor [Candidatus Methylomirabilis sp.]|nr:response regulator transcription factor [Candidatus Methylomirabilis sp.]
MAITLVLADDHPIILDGLELLFRSEQDFQVLARCVNGREALQAVRQHRPDVLILDIRMPGMDGIAVLRRLREESLTTRVVVLTVSLGEEELMALVRLGVRGVVLKEMAPQMLVQCVRKVNAGEQWLEKRSFGRAMEKMLVREAGMREVAEALTPREVEIVRMVAAGHRNKEIGDRLSISEGTVKLHLHHIYEKLHLEGRLELALYAQSKGLL